MTDSTTAPPERCDTQQRRAVMRESQQLGIPRNYGRVRELVVVREPRELACVGEDIHARMQWLAPRAARALTKLRVAAAADGIELQLVSAFRSARYQLGILQRKLERGETVDEILRVSAAPGYSEHHSGRAVDFTTPGFAALEEVFETSAAFAWLSAHAARFGFALSYPRGNRHAIAYEPWHWCWHSAARTSPRP
jgi:D-alanyl-D-alanine carboxypeptidase